MRLPKEPRGVLAIRVMVAARVDGDRCIAVLASHWARSGALACEPNDALSRARRTKKGARGLEPGALACGLRRGKGGRVKPLCTPRMLV